MYVLFSTKQNDDKTLVKAVGGQVCENLIIFNHSAYRRGDKRVRKT